MTQEEKAKAYDEAIAVINKCETDKYGCIIGIKPSDIFPELAESEDERIKSAAIEFVRQNKSFNYLLGVSKEDVIIWLEKQGEKGVVLRDAFGYEWNFDEKELKKIEQPAWSKEDEDMLYKATAVINRLCAARREYVWSVNTLDKLFYWLKSLKDRVQPQPKQEWSEEVDLEKEIEKCLKRHNMLAVGKKDFTDIAKYFFELGLKAKRGA